MKTLAKIGAAMTLIAVIMTAGFYNFIKADETHLSKSTKPADRVVTTENRSITAAVNEIEMNGSVDVILKHGDVAAINVKGEQRLLGKLKTEVRGNLLSISLEGIHFNRNHTQVEVTLPNLQKITLNGSGDAEINGFKGEKIQIAVNGSGDVSFNGEYQNISANLRGSGGIDLGHAKSKMIDLEIVGSGDVTVQGDVENLSAKMNGAGDIDAENLHADNVNLTLNGSGDTSVYAKKSVTAVLHGSGDVRVHGQPGQRNITKTGSGEVDFE